MIRFLFDMGLPRRAAKDLQAEGIDAVHLGRLGMARPPDEQVIELAVREGSTIATLDRDFSQIIAVSGARVPSVVRRGLVDTCLAIVCGLWSTALVVAQAKQPEAKAPLTGGGTVITDEATNSPMLVFGDARSFRARVAGDQIECALEMAKPLIEGMFTCVELWIDCDDKPATGLEGRELRIRAAVGSRFQPSDAAPATGTRKPIDHLRISGTDLQPDGSGGKRWVHRTVQADPPVAHDKDLRFWFPRQLVRERGDRYHGRLAMRVVVTTSCSDQPIECLHVCNDEGLPIVLDGNGNEWSGPVVRDPADELHPVARCIDLTGLRLDHGGNCVFAGVELAAPGFAAWQPDADVQGYPMLTLMVEPLFPSYQEPYQVTIVGGRTQQNGRVPVGDWSSHHGDRLVEVRLPRKQGQNRLRILALSDLILTDTFDRELRLDAEVR